MAAKKPDYSGGENVVSAELVLTDIAGIPTPATGKSLTNAKTLDVSIVDGTGTQITSFGGGTQFADGAARGTATGTLAMGDDGVNIQSIKTDTNGVLAVQDNGGSLTVDGVFFQGTQPVSAATLPLPTGAATLAAQTQPGVDIGDVTNNNAGGAAAVNIQDGGNSITVDGTVTTSPPANASTNVAQLAGTSTSVNSGLKDAGTLRVVLATDQPALTNKLLVTPDSVALPANQSVNVNQFGGSVVVTGTGAGGVGIPRVTVSSDSAITSISGSVTPGTAAGNLGKAEDSAHTTADTGVFTLGVRRDIPNLPSAAATDTNLDYSASALDSFGVAWVRTRQLVTYSAAYRLADATAGQLGLTFTFAANTNKQLATIHHVAGLATKTVKIRKVVLTVSAGAAGVFDFELRALNATTAPATGNPNITPRMHDAGDAAAEATCLALPTTAGSTAGVDNSTLSPVFTWNSAAAAATSNPSGLAGQDIVLYEYKDGMEMKPITLRSGVGEGLAVNARCTAAVALRFSVYILFTEE